MNGGGGPLTSMLSSGTEARNTHLYMCPPPHTHTNFIKLGPLLWGQCL